MIAVEELLYEIDLRINRQATLQHQSIHDEDKVIALQNAQIKYIVQKIGPANNAKLGLDSFLKRYEDLRILIEKFEDHPLPLELVDTKLNKWEADLSTLLPQYMFYVDAYALGSKGKCKDVIISVNHDLTKHKEVITLMNSSHYKPSFEYQETFDTLSGNSLELYTDGTFTLTECFLSYIRYPKPIDMYGYVKLDGTESIKQDCELPYYLKDSIINLAIEELAMSIGDRETVQNTELKLQKE